MDRRNFFKGLTALTAVSTIPNLVDRHRATPGLVDTLRKMPTEVKVWRDKAILDGLYKKADLVISLENKDCEVLAIGYAKFSKKAVNGSISMDHLNLDVTKTGEAAWFKLVKSDNWTHIVPVKINPHQYELDNVLTISHLSLVKGDVVSIDHFTLSSS